MTIAIIMARGGSKRIPRKNIKKFAGQPAVAWAVDAAVGAGFDSVIISTDDDEIADAAIRRGAKQPFKRPAELANDYATTLDVLRHDIAAVGGNYELCCCLYGTSVFATSEMLLKGRTIIENNPDCEAVMCAVQFEHPPQRGFSVDGDRAKFVSPQNYSMRTQDRTPLYHDIGLFYWLRVSSLNDLSKKSLADFVVYPLILPRGTVVDIDTEEDWVEAERIVKNADRKK